MKVVLDQVSKRFGAQRVLRNAGLVLESGSITGVTGPNGSGKSTLLQIIAGSLQPDDGTVTHEHNGVMIPEDGVFRTISIAAPYLNLYEDLSLNEALLTHTRFKQLRNNNTPRDFWGMVDLEHARNKQIRDLSSGMLQRFKLGLAIVSDTPLLLLDEPGSNLDAYGMEWYHNLLNDHTADRTVLVCSNREQEELSTCSEIIRIQELASD
jgi:ABC-type multidrug transport system ATPase subunit